MGKYSESKMENAKAILSGRQPEEVFKFACERVGRLLGFSFYDAVNMAESWKDATYIIPTGMDEPSTGGLMIVPETAVYVNIPIFRVRYVNTKTGKPVTYADMKLAEIQQGLASGVIKAVRMPVTDENNVAACYNMWPSHQWAHDNRKYPTWTMEEWRRTLVKEDVFGISEFCEILASKVGRLEDADAQAVIASLVDEKFTPSGQDIDVPWYVDFVRTVAALELLAYLGGAGNYYECASAKLKVMEGLTISEAIEAAGAKYRQLVAGLDADELYMNLERAHDVATMLAKLAHDIKIIRPGAKDNFDVLEDLAIEAMADMKLGQLRANYIQTLMRNGGLRD